MFCSTTKNVNFVAHYNHWNKHFTWKVKQEQRLRSEFYFWLLEWESIQKPILQLSDLYVLKENLLLGFLHFFLFLTFKWLGRETNSYLVCKESLLKNYWSVLSVSWWFQRRAVCGEPADKETCKHNVRSQGWGCKQDGNAGSPESEKWMWQHMGILWGCVVGDNFW